MLSDMMGAQNGNNLIFDESHKLRIVTPELTTSAEDVISSGTQYKELLQSFVDNNSKVINNMSKLTVGVEEYKSELTGLQFVLTNRANQDHRSKELDQAMLLADIVDYERALDERDVTNECAKYTKNVKGGLVEVFGVL